MIPRVVTTAGPVWESELADRARATGRLRIVDRAFHPVQVQRALAGGRARAVLVGGEIPWLSPGLIRAWRRMGAVVIGVDHPDQPSARRLLEQWGCHVVIDEADPEWTAAAFWALAPSEGSIP